MAKKSRKARNIKRKLSNKVGIDIGANQLRINNNITDEEIIQKLYKLEPPTCLRSVHKNGNCLNITQCTNGFENNVNNKIKPMFNINNEIKNLGKNPSEYLRESDSFIGLENLGATCYMNSLLQCLFMNINFRNSVYLWIDSDDYDNGDDDNNVNDVINEDLISINSEKQKRSKENKIENSILFQLQFLFANLQYSLFSSFSPETLISLLNIKATIQQDAQEFNKLFISYLEEKFKTSQKNEKLKTFICDEFQGKYAYNTICSQCNQTSKREGVFYELELNIQNHHVLEDCINEYIREEELVDSNQYDCPNCGLVNAKRMIKLLSLPPTLNFQLLRYGYDMNAEKKIKLKTRVQFPSILDMSSFVDEHNDKTEENIYELTAVLMHLGNSAYGGHYIAQIKDESTSQWWKFNDSVVTKIGVNEIGESPSIYDDNDNDQFSASSSSKRKKQTIKQNNEHCSENDLQNSEQKMNHLSSSNAYMLIYSKKGHSGVESISPPEYIMSLINNNNASLMNLIEQYETEKRDLIEYVTKEKELYQKVTSSIKFDHQINDEFQWIDAIWFAKFIKAEKNIEKITNTNLLCPHNYVDPKKINRAKQISVTSANLLFERYGGGPVLTRDDICYECAILYYEEMILENERKEMRSNMLKLVSMQNNASQRNKVGKYYFISRDWLTKWKRLASGELQSFDHQLNQNITEDITCPHQNLSVVEARKLAEIPQIVWKYLKESYPETRSEFLSTTSKCSICIKEAEEYKSIISIRTQERLKEKKSLESLSDRPVNKHSLPNAGVYYLIPNLWHSEWKSYINDPHSNERPEIIDNSSFLCEHEKLIINPILFSNQNHQNQKSFLVIREKDWHLLVDIYKGGPAISFTISENRGIQISPEICESCKALKDQADFELRLKYKNKNIWVVPTGFGSNRSIPKRVSVNVSCDDSIIDVKVKLMQSLHLTPVEQQLSFNDEILDNPSTTLAECNIFPGCTLELQKLERNDENDAIDDNEEAFERSILISSSSYNVKVDNNNNVCNEDDNDEEGDDIHINEPQIKCIIPSKLREITSHSSISAQSSPSIWECSFCTYHNELSFTNCEMCNKAQPKQNFWNCKFCTYKNPNQQKVCEICKNKC